MEVDWPQHQLDRYAADATLLEQRLQQGTEPYLLGLAFDLIRTYISMPRERQAPGTADVAITRLARRIYHPLQQSGAWSEILYLWPLLCQIAAHMSERETARRLTVQLAVVQNNCGFHAAAEAHYTSLITATEFSDLSSVWQAEILHQLCTCCLDQSKYANAQRFLEHGLRVTAGHNLAIDALASNLRPTMPQPEPSLWELRTYLLNLCGNLALLRGEFRKARRAYEEALVIYQEHGEEENLACVAYQSLGRLLLHERKFEAALLILEKNHQVCRRRGVREGLVGSNIFLAAALIGLGRYDPAEALLREALAESKAMDNPVGLAHCLFYWGQLAAKIGHCEEAIAEWQRTLKTLQSVQCPLIELPALVGLGHALIATGRIRASLPVLVRIVRHLAQRDTHWLNRCRLLMAYCSWLQTSLRAGSMSVRSHPKDVAT
ncbi:MAG TPA: hypothetical protein PKE45_07670 [Caldilineaceae bacterium]|nr:hypothetical protein [Caldilineaceae bacterium]